MKDQDWLKQCGKLLVYVGRPLGSIGIGMATKRPASAHKNAVKQLLDADSLLELLETAKSCPRTPEGNLEFSAYQNKVFERIFPGFTYQFCATSQVSLSEKGEMLDLNTVSWNLPDECIQSYMVHGHLDELSPMVYANPGRALNYTYVCRHERVEEHPFFIEHCHKFGIHHAISVGFLHPGHESTFLSFDFLGDENNIDWVPFNHIKIELASFPFALAWLYRAGIFDESKLRKMFLLLQGLTESRLLNLRKYINASLQSFDQQANDLGIRASTLKEDLALIRNSTMYKLNLTVPENRNTPTRLLDQHFGFLLMLGDHTAPLIETLNKAAH